MKPPRQTARDALAALRALEDPQQAEFLLRFFKTGPGQYGEGDRFLGIRVPVTRAVAKRFCGLSSNDVVSLLQSPWHEVRLLALLVWVEQFQRGEASVREGIVQSYLAQAAQVNNWDLVDLSADKILGAWLLGRPRVKLLDRLAASPLLWERRIAVVCTLALIRKGEFADTVRLCEKLLGEKHDLMHKACGWMLREVGKKSLGTLRDFLDTHAAVMPRTMLRYSIEKLEPQERNRYLQAKSQACC